MQRERYPQPDLQKVRTSIPPPARRACKKTARVTRRSRARRTTARRTRRAPRARAARRAGRGTTAPRARGRPAAAATAAAATATAAAAAAREGRVARAVFVLRNSLVSSRGFDPRPVRRAGWRRGRGSHARVYAIAGSARPPTHTHTHTRAHDRDAASRTQCDDDALAYLQLVAQLVARHERGAARGARRGARGAVRLVERQLLLVGVDDERVDERGDELRALLERHGARCEEDGLAIGSTAQRGRRRSRRGDGGPARRRRSGAATATTTITRSLRRDEAMRSVDGLAFSLDRARSCRRRLPSSLDSRARSVTGKEVRTQRHPLSLSRVVACRREERSITRPKNAPRPRRRARAAVGSARSRRRATRRSKTRPRSRAVGA